MNLGVLLVDDEPLIRSGLRAIINAEPDITVIGEAEAGAAVTPLVRRLRPDVVLMDVRMPAVDGIEATRRLLANVDDPPRILVLTTFDNDDYVFDALRAGASGFLLKRARPDEVIRAIRLLAAGDSLLFPAAIRDLAARHAPADDRAGGLDGAGLTDCEADVLRLMPIRPDSSPPADLAACPSDTRTSRVAEAQPEAGLAVRTEPSAGLTIAERHSPTSGSGAARVAVK